MRPLSHVLQELIVLGEQVIARPLAMASADRTARWLVLKAEIEAHVRRPEEFTRATAGGSALLLQIAEHWSAGGGKDKQLAMMWLMLIGATLPIVRYELGVAHANEQKARAG